MLRETLRVGGGASAGRNLRSSPEIAGIPASILWLPVEAVVVPGLTIPV